MLDRERWRYQEEQRSERRRAERANMRRGYLLMIGFTLALLVVIVVGATA